MIFVPQNRRHKVVGDTTETRHAKIDSQREGELLVRKPDRKESRGGDSDGLAAKPEDDSASQHDGEGLDGRAERKDALSEQNHACKHLGERGGRGRCTSA